MSDRYWIEFTDSEYQSTIRTETIEARLPPWDVTVNLPPDVDSLGAKLYRVAWQDCRSEWLPLPKGRRIKQPLPCR